MSTCEIDRLGIVEKFSCYWLLPVVTIYSILFVHEIGHLVGNFVTGGGWGTIDLNVATFVAHYEEDGNQFVRILSGPLFGFLTAMIVVRRLRYSRLARSCGGLKKWRRYRVVGLFALFYTMWESIYVLPIDFTLLGFPHADGQALSMWLAQNAPEYTYVPLVLWGIGMMVSLIHIHVFFEGSPLFCRGGV